MKLRFWKQNFSELKNKGIFSRLIPHRSIIFPRKKTMRVRFQLKLKSRDLPSRFPRGLLRDLWEEQMCLYVESNSVQFQRKQDLSICLFFNGEEFPFRISCGAGVRWPFSVQLSIPPRLKQKVVACASISQPFNRCVFFSTLCLPGCDWSLGDYAGLKCFICSNYFTKLQGAAESRQQIYNMELAGVNLVAFSPLSIKYMLTADLFKRIF